MARLKGMAIYKGNMPKTRWVRKSNPKSKGWKKTGRFRKRKVMKGNKSVKKKNMWIAIMHPPKGFRMPYPDNYYTTITADHYITTQAAATGFGGQPSTYCNFSMNSAYRPFNGSLCNYINSLSYSATAAGNPGFEATAVQGFTLSDNLPNLTMFQSMYQKYIIYKQTIIIEANTTSVGDSFEMAIAPVPGYNSTIPAANNFRTLCNAKNVRTARAQPYGEAGSKNRVINRTSLAELVGRPSATVEDLISQGSETVGSIIGSVWGYTALGSAPAHNLGWWFGARTLDSVLTTGAAVNFRIKTINKICFFEPYTGSGIG